MNEPSKGVDVVLVKDLITEGEVFDEIIVDLIDLIVAYQQSNNVEIPVMGPRGALVYLHRLGYDIDREELMDILSSAKFDKMVERSDPETIKLAPASPEVAISKSKEEKNQEEVDKTATKVATKMVKSKGAM